MNELRWLTALEAGLFFSIVCWETTAPWAAPTYHPETFLISLLIAATITTVTCHVGPAFYARRFPIPAYILLWLAFGYLEWLRSLVATAYDTLEGSNRLTMALGFLGAFAILPFLRTVWKIVVGTALALGVGILVWALVTEWHGIWATNPHYGLGPAQLSENFVPGVLLAAAPAAAIACRIGKLATTPASIWLTGLWGVWLPLILAVTCSSFATDAGATLHWIPTLFRGFYWALQSPRGVNETALALSYATMALPALLCAFSIRILAIDWREHRAWWLVPCILCGASLTTNPAEGFHYSFFTESHRIWSWSVVALGASAGVRAIFR